jgi:PhnB protein
MPAKATKTLEDFHTITPHLTVRGVAAAIAFYARAFGSAELYRNVAPDGKSIMHAELLLGDSRFFIHDEFPGMGATSPLGLSSTPVTIHLYVEDVDSLYQQALGAGAKVVMPLADQFWGDRYGVVEDPSGHRWALASHVRDMTPQQMKEAADALFGGEEKGAGH